MKTNKSTFSIGGMQQQPRSFADYVAGRSTVKYNRAAKPKAAKFKPKPSSNGIGVGF